MIKNMIKNFWRRKFFPSSRSSPMDNGPKCFHFVEGVLCSVLAQKANDGFLEVIQVGANDGYTVDPIYNFACRLEPQRVRLTGVEPIPEVFESLKRTYKSHPNFTAYNYAVGINGNEKIYRIKPEYWPYYRGIMGSGVSSMDYEHVWNKAKNQLPNKLIKGKGVNELIDEIAIPSISLEAFLEREELTPDFIQIDAEGYDDAIIYSLNMNKTKPKAIAFESSLLNTEKRGALFTHLIQHGYLVARASTDDHCALLRSC